MSNSPHPSGSRDLAGLLRTVEQTRHERVQGMPPDPRLALLREWQVERLKRTHHDLLHHPRYQAASLFFIHDVYANRDFSQRNYDLRRMHDTFRRWVPEWMIHPLALAIALHELTEELDFQLLEVLVNRLGLTERLTGQMYAEAYRRCDNYAVRVRQIEWIADIGNGIEGLVNLPLSGTMIRLARGPATRGGWGELMDFLARGYAAFKQMRGAKYFLDTIQEREMRILDRIYAGDSDPFDSGNDSHSGK